MTQEQAVARPVTSDILQTISAREGVDTKDLPPLGHVLDTEALDDLFDPHQRPGRKCPSLVRFTYNGYLIEVDEERSISLEPMDSL